MTHTYTHTHSPICAEVSGCFGTLQGRKKGRRPHVPAPCVSLLSSLIFFSVSFTYNTASVIRRLNYLLIIYKYKVFYPEGWAVLPTGDPSLTCVICVHLPSLSITTAHHSIMYNSASTALEPIAIVEAATTAELAKFLRVRNPPTAAVTQPHGDPALRVVRTAVFIYRDKDRWGEHFNNSRVENCVRVKSWGDLKLTVLYMNIVSCTALVLRESWKQFAATADGVGGVTQTQVTALAALMLWFLSVQKSTAANLEQKPHNVWTVTSYRPALMGNFWFVLLLN